ncbi:MAG: UvrB/UvrC motif-containing protein [Clostridia bacterium]|nr:UvrB/UvrC motif-containing protein [Clostridia bacterium]
MLCQNCNKNEANVRYTQIINGEKKEMFLCEECSKKLGIDSMALSLPISFSNFFGDLLDEYNSDFMPLLKRPDEIKCDKCNTTYSEFVQTGKFGCDSCYDAFSERIDPLLKRLHGSNRYSGRKAELNKIDNTVEANTASTENEKTTSNENKIEVLREKLKQLVKEEKYEEAAKVRDEIKSLEVQE